MKRIILPELPDMPLPFYLAVEEWAARQLPADEYFFAWQVAPTIICGRHQDIAAEVDLDAARAEGIEVWRRKSGGGAVLADRNNVMFSHITPSSHVETTFGSYTGMICRMLASLGIEAMPTGRNDIAAGGRKVAGNAFYKLPGRSIVHGTMLYDADFALMGRVLTPSTAKRLSKGVVSVPSRVTTLRALGLGMSCADFVSHALAFLCPGDGIRLSDADIEEVRRIMQSYLRPDFLKISGSIARHSSTYIDGVGEVYSAVTCDNCGLISDISLRGDFFALRDVRQYLCGPLAGLPLHRPTLAATDAVRDVGLTIAGMTPETFLNLILSSHRIII